MVAAANSSDSVYCVAILSSLLKHFVNSKNNFFVTMCYTIGDVFTTLQIVLQCSVLIRTFLMCPVN